MHALPGDNKSSEAVAAFLALHDDLVGALMDCPSGQELTAKGYAADVDLAAAHDVADAVAVRLVDGAYVDQSKTAPRNSSRRPVKPS